MDRLADLEINRAVRRILVRHWIELGKLTIRSLQGIVSLSGMLHRLPAAQTPLNGNLVSAILSEIRRVPDVRRVRVTVVNWEAGVNGWRETSRPSGAPSRGAAGAVMG